jgi:hypothetical protein
MLATTKAAPRRAEHDSRRQERYGMTERPVNPAEEASLVAEATALLAQHGIPETSREFRLRQEFFRHGWDVRVRDDGGVWTVRAVKPDRPDVDASGSTEGNALRLALAQMVGHDAVAAS